MMGSLALCNTLFPLHGFIHQKTFKIVVNGGMFSPKEVVGMVATREYYCNE